MPSIMRPSLWLTPVRYHHRMSPQTLSQTTSSCQAFWAMKGTRNLANMSLRSLSFPKPILETFSLVRQETKKRGLFSPRLMILLREWKKKHLAMFAMLVPTWQTRTENLFKAMPPSASCIVFFFFFGHDFSAEDPKCKYPLSSVLVLQLYKAKGESNTCLCVLLVYTHSLTRGGWRGVGGLGYGKCEVGRAWCGVPKWVARRGKQ